MPAPEIIEAAVQQYFTAFSNRDLEGIVGLFAEDATVEDPVGSEVNRGIDAIRAFYGKSIEMGATLQQQGATRITAEYAAFAFHAIVPGMGHVEVIDAFRFNEAGKVVEMRAYFGAGNFKQTA
jgi:steroid delta-isomerase